ncbi:MAG: choice-of-anchor D domain-containing protein [Akkermansiaceae bacterium]|nr:choice-of-anchor D domain-containing protein [Akkermansiaceae bacterium]
MKKLPLSLLPLGILTSVALSQTTVVEETFTYSDGAVDVVGTGGTGWDATEGGWQTGNSVSATHHFEVVSNTALYLGGGVSTYTEQNRTFAAPLTSAAGTTLTLNFDLIYDEQLSGRGIGIYLTNGGANQFFIGKRVNGSVGLHSSMGAGTTYVSFTNTNDPSSSGMSEPVTAIITSDGADTSIVLSDSNETLAAHTFAGSFTFDGISLAGYNGATTTNGIDDIVVTSLSNPDPWVQGSDFYQFTQTGGLASHSVSLSNAGLTQPLTISSVTAGGSDPSYVSNIQFPASIATGGSGDITFDFDATDGTGLYTFTLSASTNDTVDGDPFVIDIEIDVVDPIVGVSTDTVDFGSLANNPGPQIQTFDILNEGGSEDLDIFDITLSGDSEFTITGGQTPPFTIAPGGSETIEVTFDPGTRPGGYSGSISIDSNDYDGNMPEVALVATTAVSTNLVADYPMGDGSGLSLASTDAAAGSTAAVLVETDLGARTEFGGHKTGGLIDGSAFPWSRREAPNNGLDLTTVSPTEALAFTLTPAPGATVDLSVDGWLTVEIGAFSTLSGATTYGVALAVDDGVSPFVLGPVAGASIPGVGEDKAFVTFDVRSLGSFSAPVTFSVMPQTTGATNGTVGQAGGYLDRITLGGTESIASTPALVVNAGESFSNEGLPESYSFAISNAGLAQLDISSVATDGSGEASAFTNITFDTPLAASGGSGFVDFDFTPVGPGTYTTNFVITSNDPASPATVAISIEVLDPEISVATGSLDFGDFDPSPGQQTLSVTVTNAGEANDLVVNAGLTAITGTNASEFGIVSVPGPIAPGATGDIVVSFDPGVSEGQFFAELSIVSNDSNGATPTVSLVGYVRESLVGGVIVARYDFDGSHVVDDVASVDIDASAGTPWTTSDLLDQATGTGALSASNQAGGNREVLTGPTGNLLLFSCNRESDAQTPVTPGGSDESTWTLFSVSPESGGSIDFDGGSLSIDTYATTSIGGASANWSLYYSTNGGTTWSLIAGFPGASSTSGLSAATPITWDLSSLGTVSSEIQFALDPVATSSTNGVATQRGVGFDNLVLTAAAVNPPGGGFADWASNLGIPNDPQYDGTDFDGISALVEYALGLSPLVSEGSPGTLASGVLSFAKGSEAVASGDVTFAIEVSDDLGISDPWETVTPDVNNATTISYTLPTGQTAVFARLVVVRIP